MNEFEYKSVCILGRQPALGLAELESLYGAQDMKAYGNAALLSLDAAEVNFKRLGGTVKVARILTVLPTVKWREVLDYLIENIPKHLQYVEPGKFTLGISAYGLAMNVNQINQGALAIKKAIKLTERPVRIVPNKTLELNSAQVLHNKLTHRGAWELNLLKYGQQTILAQTFFVQDIEAYAARDQARPKRDARVGMLPPKLAQTLINLAGPTAEDTVLDPFCGTGVVLQEAQLMGYSAVGTDLEPRMIEYSKDNMDWLRRQYPDIATKLFLAVGDATTFKWPHFDVVATEVFLGRALTTLPETEKLKNIIHDTDTILRKFLINLLPQVEKDKRISLAVPAWKRPQGGFYHLPLIDHLTEMGYNLVDFKHASPSELIYHRPDQTVARQLLVLVKR